MERWQEVRFGRVRRMEEQKKKEKEGDKNQDEGDEEK